MRKGDPDVQKVNEILATIPQSERTKLMDAAIEEQPADTSGDSANQGLLADFKKSSMTMVLYFYEGQD